MEEYWYEKGFGDQAKEEDDKATVYDSEDLNEVTSWETDKTELM